MTILTVIYKLNTKNINLSKCIYEQNMNTFNIYIRRGCIKNVATSQPMILYSHNRKIHVTLKQK